MQAIMETGFDIIYLVTVITLGILMIKHSNNNKGYLLFGVMAVILGFGDSFHLIPRSYALCTTGLENFTYALGLGKLITSITMTIFYVILYHIWKLRYKVDDCKNLTLTIYCLAIFRIVLCLFPQNAWTSADAPVIWGIYRNIPFLILGIIIIVLYYTSARKNKDNNFKYMWLAITLSFAFYVPVVLFADAIPLFGMLMIPKTCAYVWIVLMGYKDMKKQGL